MIFRPSDDVLEEISGDAQLSNTLESLENGELASFQGDNLSYTMENANQGGSNLQDVNNVAFTSVENESTEKNGGEVEAGSGVQSAENVVLQDAQTEQDFSIDLSEIQSIDTQDLGLVENNQQSVEQTAVQSVENIEGKNEIQETSNQQSDTQEVSNQQNPSELSDDISSIEGKMSDSERINIVSNIEGSVHSNLDLFVDEQWVSIVKNYIKMHRIIFKWGIFIFAAALGIFTGIFVQVKASHSGKINMINDSVIYNISEFTNEVALTNSSGSNSNRIDFLVPYGYAEIKGNDFLNKSNLVSYKGIILPQLTSIGMNSNIISLEDFQNKGTSRTDLEKLVNTLVADDTLKSKTKNIPNISDRKGPGQTLEGGLIEGFSLGCMFTTKVSNTVCDRFLDIFFKYGKYFNLSSYESDLLKLTKEIKNQKKSVEPICDMVKEYVLHYGAVPSEVLESVMSYCSEDDQAYYKRLVGFIEVENSLGQPELSNKVFDDPYLNAYKLLSAQQSVYKILDGASINKGFIISYLNFAQNLINKDKCTNKYLDSIYMDELYVFNMDELYEKLLKKGEISSDIKSQIDQINVGNNVLQQESLLRCLKTPNIVNSGGAFVDTGSYMPIEDLLAPYYQMTNRLKIRKVTKVSDTQLRLQTEIFSDDVFSAVNGTLKATISLYRIDNTLYVEKITIGNQPALSDVLNLYASSSFITFYAMLGYIDEQVGLRYKEPTEESDQKSFCEQLRENADIVVYNCDDSNILLYNGSGSVEYSFVLENGILQSFNVSDEELDSLIKEQIGELLISKDSTPFIINSIIEFKVEEQQQISNMENKLQVIDQFRIHFKTIPEVYDIEGEDSVFLVEFMLGEFNLQAYYDMNTHLLTRISYHECEKTLEIRNLTIEVSAENEGELTEILNNPRIFLTRANKAAFQKYQTMCN